MEIEYNTRLASKQFDQDRLIDFYNEHRFELRFDPVFEFFRVGHYLGDKIDILLTERIEDKKIVGACVIIYTKDKDKLYGISQLGLVDRNFRRRGISKVLAKASEMRCIQNECHSIIKVRHKNSRHLNFKKLQESGYTFKEQGDNLIMEKILK